MNTLASHFDPLRNGARTHREGEIQEDGFGNVARWDCREGPGIPESHISATFIRVIFIFCFCYGVKLFLKKMSPWYHQRVTLHICHSICVFQWKLSLKDCEFVLTV